MKIVLLFFVFFVSCMSHQKSDLKNDDTKINSQIRRNIQDVHSCTTAKDTIFLNGDYIKYVSIDTLFGVQLKFQNHIDTLNFLFDCNITNNLIPNLIYRDSRTILLKQGSGFHYRKLFVNELIGDSLVQQEFETNRIDPGSPNVLLFKYTAIKDEIFAINLEDHKIYKFSKIPSQFKDLLIEELIVSKDNLKIIFNNGVEYNFKNK